MNRLVPVVGDRAPVIVAASGERASYRFFEFFTAQIRNPHTRRAYARGDGILRLASRARRGAACGHRERACRRLYRAAAEGALCADREAAPRRLASFVRLDG